LTVVTGAGDTGQVPVSEKEEGFVTAALASSLTAADRCDRCGAQAYVRVTLAGGAELLFCAHHGRVHSDALRRVATDVQDESDRLIDAPGTPSFDEG
jgi:hypothetical protein